jgi:hypothetical protein
MTIILELPPETEASLAAQATAQGVSLAAFVQSIITMHAAAMDSVTAVELARDDEKSDRAIDELFDAEKIPPGVGEGAMRRENWYR